MAGAETRPRPRGVRGGWRGRGTRRNLGSLSQEGRGALRRWRGSRAPSFSSFQGESCEAGFGRVRCCPGIATKPQGSPPLWPLEAPAALDPAETGCQAPFSPKGLARGDTHSPFPGLLLGGNLSRIRTLTSPDYACWALGPRA